MTELVLEGVERRHGTVTAVDGVTLRVPSGALAAIVGPSGAGKTSLLRIAAGLEPPDGGRVLAGGRDLTDVPAAERGIAMVFQGLALLPHLTVAQNVGFGLRARGTPKAEVAERVAAAAERLGIGALLDRRPGQLSGGERQRVALARALAGRPRVLLLDEPFSSLDPRLQELSRDLVAEVQAETHVTTVCVTHDQHHALALGDLVAVMVDGRLRQAGTPDDVYDRPADTTVATFVGTPPMALLDAAAARAAGLAAADGTVVGIRPEAVQIGDGGMPALVERVERAGHERVWHLAAGTARFNARVPLGRAAAAGDTVHVRLDPAGVRHFDAATGAALTS